MKYPKTITLTITKEDCRGSFSHGVFSPCGCGVEESMKRRFPDSDPFEMVTYVMVRDNVDPTKFAHKPFNSHDFNRIKETGKSMKLKLTRV